MRVTLKIGMIGLAFAVAQTRVFAPSPDAAKDARRRLGPWLRVGVLPNGVPDRGAAQIPVGPLRLAFIGRLERHKEPATFIGAVRRAIEDGVDVSADVIGDGSLREELEAAVRAAALDSRVRFHGWINDPERVLRTTSAVVITSQHEGASLVVLEAAAMGRGVIARAGLEGLDAFSEGILRVTQDAGPEEFANAITTLAETPGGAVALGEAARTVYAACFTPAVAAAAWADIYRKAVRRR